MLESRDDHLQDPARAWSGYFTGAALDSWRAANPPATSRAEADFIRRVLEPRPGARILDVPCGDGRLLLELARDGLGGVGVDLGAEQIAAARRAAAEQALTTVDFEMRDMRDLPWERAFDGVICFGNSFGYLTDDDNFAFLCAVERVLVPGGRFVLDTRHVVEAFPPPFEPRTTYRTGSVLVMLEHTFDARTCRVEATSTFVQGGRIERRYCSYRVYEYAELSALLTGAGFSALRGFGDLSAQPYAPEDDRLLLLATRA